MTIHEQIQQINTVREIALAELAEIDKDDPRRAKLVREIREHGSAMVRLIEGTVPHV
ncbi:MAG: hypothetical protein AB7O24_13335 [Kofleriaceae bacterium]